MPKPKPVVAGTLTIRGVEYVIIPKAEYLKTMDSALPPGTVDAHSFTRQSIAESLRAARLQAKLTQHQLAERMGRSQTLVSQAESGSARVSERYVRGVLKACGLPQDWAGPQPKRTKRRPRRSR